MGALVRPDLTRVKPGTRGRSGGGAHAAAELLLARCEVAEVDEHEAEDHERGTGTPRRCSFCRSFHVSEGRLRSGVDPPLQRDGWATARSTARLRPVGMRATVSAASRPLGDIFSQVLRRMSANFASSYSGCPATNASR
jgi:hypothetical protein